MSQFVATKDNITLSIDDIPTNVSLAVLITKFARDGYMITYRSGTPLVVPKKKTITPVKAKAKAKPKFKSMKADPTEWPVGTKVWLAWGALSQAKQQHLSQYRTLHGFVEDTRGGQGIRDTVGVRFNSDPELTWLQPDQVSRIPLEG